MLIAKLRRIGIPVTQTYEDVGRQSDSRGALNKSNQLGGVNTPVLVIGYTYPFFPINP